MDNNLWFILRNHVYVFLSHKILFLTSVNQFTKQAFNPIKDLAQTSLRPRPPLARTARPFVQTQTVSESPSAPFKASSSTPRLVPEPCHVSLTLHPQGSKALAFRASVLSWNHRWVRPLRVAVPGWCLVDVKPYVLGGSGRALGGSRYGSSALAIPGSLYASSFMD